MLKLEKITVSFNDKTVLENLSCAINKGDFIVIVGANGAGKSTLFDLIAGKIVPKKGTVSLDGKDITNMSEIKRASFIGRLFQNTVLSSVGSMTVGQNLTMALYKNQPAGLASGMQRFPAQFLANLAQEFDVHVSHLLEKTMSALSGGQRQLVAFIMAIALPPKLLLLDEPTAALDPNAATKLLTLVNKYVRHKDITTVLITHDPHLALALGNKLWVLEQGKITRQYEKQDKSRLTPEELIGHIDYEKLKSEKQKN